MRAKTKQPLIQRMAASCSHWLLRPVSRHFKRYPGTHTAADLKTWNIIEEYEPDRWRPARPCECVSGGMKRRLKIAWKVFTGEWDAVNWGKDSGEWENSQVNYRDPSHPEWEKTHING